MQSPVGVRCAGIRNRFSPALLTWVSNVSTSPRLTFLNSRRESPSASPQLSEDWMQYCKTSAMKDMLNVLKKYYSGTSEVQVKSAKLEGTSDKINYFLRVQGLWRTQPGFSFAPTSSIFPSTPLFILMPQCSCSKWGKELGVWKGCGGHTSWLGSWFKTTSWTNDPGQV